MKRYGVTSSVAAENAAALMSKDTRKRQSATTAAAIATANAPCTAHGRDRQRVDEGTPGFRTEGEIGDRRQRNSRCRRRANGAPVTSRQQHERKQQAEMRFERQQPDQTAGQNRRAFERQQRAADQRGGDEAVLHGAQIGEDARKRVGEEKPHARADNIADRHHVKRKC
jgi:hypothetical protein